MRALRAAGRATDCCSQAALPCTVLLPWPGVRTAEARQAETPPPLPHTYLKVEHINNKNIHGESVRGVERMRLPDVQAKVTLEGKKAND